MSLPRDLKKLINKYRGKINSYIENRYETGELGDQTIHNFLENRSGLQRAYYTSGQLWTESFYLDGEQNGIGSSWYQR